MKEIKVHIERILRIADLAEKTDISLDQLNNINRDLGISYFDEAWFIRFGETNIADNALKTYLENLNDEDLSWVHAVMYSGRDNDTATIIRDSFLNTYNGTRENMTRTIIEKRNALKTYLPKGLLNL